MSLVFTYIKLENEITYKNEININFYLSQHKRQLVKYQEEENAIKKSHLAVEQNPLWDHAVGDIIFHFWRWRYSGCPCAG